MPIVLAHLRQIGMQSNYHRCLHGSNYIERVKNDNLTLRMIIFLRTSLQNLDGAKLNRMGSYVQKFLHIYKNAKLSELI